MCCLTIWVMLLRSGLRLHETDEETWKYLVDINLYTGYMCAQAAIPKMQEQKQGAIIFVSAAGGNPATC